MNLTIEDLLNSLQNSETSSEVKLENNKKTWERINKKDSFSELNLQPSALEDFLKEWIKDNPYANI